MYLNLDVRCKSVMQHYVCLYDLYLDTDFYRQVFDGIEARCDHAGDSWDKLIVEGENGLLF